MHRWDPDLYLAHSGERSRPFVELLSRVDVPAARTVVDLGCGPGHLMPVLAERWPAAALTGVDSSPEMVAEARRANPVGVAIDLADLRDWRPDSPVDVLVSNATLQWVPGHLDLLPRLAAQVARGGALAISVPANFDQPSHLLLRQLAAAEPFARWTAGIGWPWSALPGEYLDALTGPGRRVDVWQTTYLHVLTGPDPVLGWISGTGARPVLQALPDGEREEFRGRYAALTNVAYPPRADGTTVLPFTRTFAVAHVT